MSEIIMLIGYWIIWGMLMCLLYKQKKALDKLSKTIEKLNGVFSPIAKVKK